jgi:hypothetical protein
MRSDEVSKLSRLKGLPFGTVADSASEMCHVLVRISLGEDFGLAVQFFQTYT